METIVNILANKYMFDVTEAICVISQSTTNTLQEEQHNIKTIEPEKEITPHGILIECGEREYEKENTNNKWIGKDFYKISTLKSNNVGNVGENLLTNICKYGKIDVSYEGTKNKDATDGTYDVKINNKRCEIKTARIGLSDTFQHESLRNEGCDYYVFVNILHEYAYITILPKFNLETTNEIMKVRAHLRKGTSNVYKYTFCEKHLRVSYSKGYTIKIDNNTTICSVATLISNVIL